MTQSFVSVRTIPKFPNFSSTLNTIMQFNAIHSVTTETTTYALNATTGSVTKPTNTIRPLLLVREVPNDAPLLRTHDQEMVGSSRIRASKLLCKQRLSQWTVAENTIFNSGLGVDIERSAGILSHVNRFHSDYMRAIDNPGQWFQIQLEQREWQYHKQIILNDDDDTRKILISLPLPPLILKVSSEWYWPLHNEIIDFTFRIKVERLTNLNDECSYTRSATPSYKCIAIPVVRLEDGTIHTDWEISRRIFQLGSCREVEHISLQSNSS